MRTQDAIQSFLNNRRAKNLTQKTIQWYREELRRFANSYPELPTNPEPIETFLAEVRGSPETKHAYFRAIKTFYHFISERYDFPNPMKQVKPPRCPRKVMPTLEPYEVMTLLNSATTLRDRTLLTLFIDTGARTSEIAHLRKQDIKGDTILVNGKTGGREIPISDETRRLLLALIVADGKSEFVFPGRYGLPLTRYGASLIIRKLMKKAGIQGPKLGPQRIRHAFGKNFLVNGGDLRSLQQIMGHTNLTTTEKYSSLNLTDTITKHHKFTPLRSAHAAAQENLFDSNEAIKEAKRLITLGIE